MGEENKLMEPRGNVAERSMHSACGNHTQLLQREAQGRQSGGRGGGVAGQRSYCGPCFTLQIRGFQTAGLLIK